ncbi:MAG: hypothetical protein LBI54_01300 [Lachnospiraceae bacterium]|jgi:hypothetical protein|nr:hypothetical protein [Lachnospiraceae bacterium]
MEQELSNLFELFEPERLRTVSGFREMKGCPRDVRVEIELKDEACAALSFPYPWDGKFYAYYLSDQISPLDRWYITDWGDGRCQVTLERKKKQISACFVKTGEVLRLLEEARRIPAQRTS